MQPPYRSFHQIQSWPSSYLWENGKRGIRPAPYLTWASFTLNSFFDYLPLVESKSENGYATFKLLSFSTVTGSFIFRSLPTEFATASYGLSSNPSYGIPFVLFLPFYENTLPADRAIGSWSLPSITYLLLLLRTCPVEPAKASFSLTQGP